MMIRPEAYYIIYLQGRTAEELLTRIRSLKMETGQQKNALENPDRAKEDLGEPSFSTRIKWNRVFLELAKQALADVGGTYGPSQAEIKAIDFDNNIPFIKKIVWKIVKSS